MVRVQPHGCARRAYFCDFSGNLGEFASGALPTAIDTRSGSPDLRPAPATLRSPLGPGRIPEGFCRRCASLMPTALATPGFLPPGPRCNHARPAPSIRRSRRSASKTCRRARRPTVQFDGGPTCLRRHPRPSSGAPDSGSSAPATTGTCRTDRDCEGYSTNLPYPDGALPVFRVTASQMTSGEPCPTGSCQSDSRDSRQSRPARPPVPQLRPPDLFPFVCTDSSQCGVASSRPGRGARRWPGQCRRPAGWQPAGSRQQQRRLRRRRPGVLRGAVLLRDSLPPPRDSLPARCTRRSRAWSTSCASLRTHLRSRQLACAEVSRTDQECQSGVQTGVGPSCLGGYCGCAVDVELPRGRDLSAAGGWLAHLRAGPLGVHAGFLPDGSSATGTAGACTSAFSCLIDFRTVPPRGILQPREPARRMSRQPRLRDQGSAAATGASWCCPSATQCKYPGTVRPGLQI